ncbi:MAG: exosortase-associated EpsI family protein [Verrucomicrobia bacterium]|nr:MAG: exosortase-associated EpsI family protein [Verrucomicrobiota bacterium]
MKNFPPLLLVALALVLSAVGLVVYGETQIPAPQFQSSLKDLLPAAPAGWTKKIKPIADTPEMKEAVGELLNFDDGIFVDYTNSAGSRLSLYIAYWTPGKMSHRLVAGHTPDVCWVGGGWKKVESGPTPSLQQFMAAGPSANPIPTGEARVFTANGNPEYVWFWHMVGGQSKSYANQATPPWHAPLTDILSKGLAQRQEQFFIRLSSDQPLQHFYSDPVFAALLTSIPWPSPTRDS